MTPKQEASCTKLLNSGLSVSEVSKKTKIRDNKIHTFAADNNLPTNRPVKRGSDIERKLVYAYASALHSGQPHKKTIAVLSARFRQVPPRVTQILNSALAKVATAR